MEIVKLNYSIKRTYKKIFLIVARKFPLLKGKWRSQFARWAGVKIKKPKSVFLGEDVAFDGLHPEDIYIDEGTVITDGVKIITHFYKPDDGCMYRGEVHIGKSVFIGMNTLIVNAVKIGDNAVIGAGSVITKDIPRNEIWAGNPAKFIKYKNDLTNK